ncbi:RecQ family ATP-dependent DNA helicase [Micromonospora sp. DR5-3]|uniref:RecQ family ATP-dependent DNA helicase n=1 Tax=unclassified Micromonospora TaxID=2617518 RepID=UPI0011DC6996|nr:MULTISPECIES: RecQ family ATP-dependent DNA helicase [unclassified Micromonospora]MCW3816400.1 RecQ family ATP-dependent DNA helicase [Micromonospora sp. DR5-3]TYC22729.1 RecQ family ATP-dependent DNA helicase [Micromonospora sp. MP36]
MMFMFRSLRLRRAARRHFGWQQLRPAQLRAMRALLAGRDALVVLPTGGGKSAVYQVPATLLRGPTVVISPLLALQQDQIGNLNERGDPALRAVRISSAESPRKQAAAMAELRSGAATFLFITPEQLSSPERLAEVRALRPALVAVDEAHCISSWGHDFRPDYLTIGHLIRELGRPPVVALTATASPPVRDDITARLGMRKPRLVLGGLDRLNLFVAATHCPSEDHRWRKLLGFLKEADRPGIVYVPTRRAAEELAERLSDVGFPAEAYHGGMAAGVRHRRHEDFLADRVSIMVATSAFGMGIDKPNIRWVAHVALPDSPDSYLQEIGRAGRDGMPARALLLHRPEDVALQRFFTGGAPDLGELRAVAAALHRGPLTRTALAKETGLGPRKVASHLSLLEQVGAVATGPRGELTVARYAPLPDEAARQALAEYARYQAGQRSRTDMMRRFAESAGCRMQSLLGYFGEQLSLPCGHCDNCDGGTSEVIPDDGPYPLHSTVRHAKWGPGVVLGYENDRMTVLFDDVGYKTLSVAVVQTQGLLALEANRR